MCLVRCYAPVNDGYRLAVRPVSVWEDLSVHADVL